MFQERPGKYFIEVVKNLKRQNLFKCNERVIAGGSSAYSDGWKHYKELTLIIRKRISGILKFNHSDYFINASNSDYHTQKMVNATLI